MKENQNSIDSLFRNTLKTYREEPPVDVKGNIHKKLDASYLKKGFFTGKNLFLSGLIIAVCTAGASLFFIFVINNSSASKVYAKEIVYPNHQSIERTIENKDLQLAQNNTSNKATAENHNNPTDQKILGQSTNIQNQKKFNKLISQNKEGNGNVGDKNSTANSSVKNNQQNKTNTLAENKQQTKNNEQKTINNKTQTTNNDQQTKNSEKQSNTNPVADNNEVKTNSSANNNQQNKTNTSTENKQQVNTVNADNKTTESNSATNSSSNTNPANSTEKTVTNSDNSSAKTSSSTNPDNAKLSSSNANDQSETTDIANAAKGEQKLKPSKFSVDAFVSPSFIMSSGAKTISSGYGNVDKKSLISYNWGIEAKYDLNSNFFLQSGVNYSVYKDKISYDVKLLTSLDTSGSDWYYNTYTVNHTDTIGWDSTGGVWQPITQDTLISVTDTSWLHKADSTFYKNNGKTVNTISYVEFPFLIGYTFVKYNLTFRITTGISYGILRGASWKPDVSLISGNSELILDEAWKKNIYSYILRVGCFYSLNTKLSVFAQPSLKLNLNSVFDKDFSMTKKYQMFGINMGVNYKF